MKVLLASGSPRRKELLQSAGIEFELAVLKEVEEVFDNNMDVENVPLYLAKQKADAYLSDLSETQILLTADTDVILNGEILGKPNGRSGAVEMLQRLSGCQHSVITGVVIVFRERSVEFSVETLVTFKNLSQKLIEQYVDTCKPFDKAGSYGIQEEFVAQNFIENVDGVLSNVIGLPIERVVEEINKIIK